MRSSRIALAGVLALLLGASGCGGDDEKKGNEGLLDLSGLLDFGSGDVAEDTSTLSCQISQDCPSDKPVCDINTKVCVECKTDGHCFGSKPHCHPARLECVECLLTEHCPTGFLHCLDGECSDLACVPNASVCVGSEIHTCSADGMNPKESVVSCGTKFCQNAKCLECKPGELTCKESDVIQCNADGSAFQVLQTCPVGTSCFGGQCMVCYPGAKKCEGSVPYACNAQGNGWDLLPDCAPQGLKCIMGTCISPCASDIKQNTNAGCEFYAVDLDNAYYDAGGGDIMDAWSAQYAVIASNTSKETVATVTLQRPDGVKDTVQVQPNSLHKFLLPSTWGLNNTEKGMKSFKINSTLPITVYQFNPLSNEDVFSNDASVLLPTPSLGANYYVMSYPEKGSLTYRGFVTVVGTSPTATTVTIKPTAKTLAGAGINSINAGQVMNVSLEQGEVFNLECDDVYGDLTGTLVTATAPVAVFSGHEASTTGDACCADHMEQQMVPVEAWGTTYLVTRSYLRWMEKDHVTIVAAHVDTHVTLKPPVATVPTLQPGKSYSFATGQNVEITSDKPIMVAQFLASSHEILGEGLDLDFCFDNSDCPPNYTCDMWSGCIPPSCTSTAQCPSGHTCASYSTSDKYCQPIGDPSMILSVPVEQYLDSYVFLTPDAYAKDYVNIIAPTDATYVTLDDQNLPLVQFQPIGTSGYGVYTTEVKDGVHTLRSDKKVGVVSYGYDKDVSYGYPGGMALEKK